jgi:hypothetical protein
MAPSTSQPTPSAGLITFYLVLPAHASSVVNAATPHRKRPLTLG